MTTFQGLYVNEMTEAFIASALSGVHAIAIGGPGWGKTRVAMAAAKAIAGNGFSITRLDPSTPPEKIVGVVDPAALMDNPPRFVTVTDGTPYDSSRVISILDEVSRANDVVFDILLDVFDRIDADTNDSQVVWGTANFMPESERTKALIDRPGIWVHVRPNGGVDIAQIAKEQLAGMGNAMELPVKCPTWQEVLNVRAMRPTVNSIAACSRVMDTLITECAAGVDGTTFDVNPRRTDQWGRILFRVSAYYYGTNDFTEVHPKASDILKWAYPTTSYEVWTKWAEIAGSVADVVGAAIENVKSAAYAKFRDVRERAKANGLKTSAIVTELGTLLASATRDLEKLGDDERIQSTVDALTAAYGKIASGQDPF